jgi:hypothetical protein
VRVALHTKSLLKKSPTSSVVDGPPMFMKTIAVGPLELVASCVTGGTGVANDRNWSALLLCHNEVVGVAVSLETVDCDALLVSWLMGVRKAIAMMKKRHRETYYNFVSMAEAFTNVRAVSGSVSFKV